MLNLEQYSPKRKYPKFIVLGIGYLFLFVNFTLAANITINNNSSTEFGQGYALTTTCDTYLTVNFTSEFDNATSKFNMKNMTLGDISTKLHDKKVTLSLLNESTNQIVSSSNLYFDIDSTGTVFTSPLSTTSNIDYTTVSTGGANEVGTSSITFINLLKQNGSKIPTEEVNRVIIETSQTGECTVPVITCANGGTCALGETGPGGGPVIYVAQTPFTEPVSGNTYKYIEAAPKNWVTGVTDPNSFLCSDSNQISGALSEAIGSAIINTNAYLAEADCIGSSSASNPAGLLKIVSEIRKYGSTWNLPTLAEVQAMCKFARFGATIAPTKTNCDDSGGSLDTVNWLSTSSYASSSKQSGVGWSSYVTFNTGVTNKLSAVQATRSNFRPIRYFN